MQHAKQIIFFVPSNDLPETFRGGQTCCPVVVGVGDAGMGMMQWPIITAGGIKARWVCCCAHAIETANTAAKAAAALGVGIQFGLK
jgi:hypothetical protein